VIEVKNVHKVYKTGAAELAVLQNIDLTIREGEFVAICGPSGAGKSTLLHIMGGLDRPTAGTVLIDGNDIYASGDRERARVRNAKVGFVFQSYHLLPEFSALENVTLPMMMRPDARRSPAAQRPRERSTALLEMVGLGARAAHRPGELSGGEQQRVALARAMINEPAFLLCDEPTGNLDSASGQAVIELLVRLSGGKKTAVVVVTHDGQIAKRADRILNIRDGKIV